MWLRQLQAEWSGGQGDKTCYPAGFYILSLYTVRDWNRASQTVKVLQ